MFHSLTYGTWWSFPKHSLLHEVRPNTTVRFQRCTRRCCTMYLVVNSAAFRTSNYLEMHTPTQCRRNVRIRLKCDGTRTETRFRLPMKRTRLFKSAGASLQSTTGSRGVRISGCNAGYTMFQGSVKSTGYPLHLPLSPSLPLLCVTMCHHISTGLYLQFDDVVFKHKHSSDYNGLFSGNNTESYDHTVVEDDVPLLENPYDSFLNDILHRKQACN